MKATVRKGVLPGEPHVTALEENFPVVEISQVAERESWRKEINRPLSHIHKWWATRLGSVFRALTIAALTPRGTSVWDSFYKQHNFSEKVVLDPFMGSGTTIGEAVKVGAKAIGCDINPVSTFLVRQALTRVSEQDLKDSFQELSAAVASDILQYFVTSDPESGKTLPVRYFFWVKTVETPAGETVPLFDRYVFAQDAYPKRKPRAHIVCPGCWGVMEERYDATRVHCPNCGHSFNPQEGPVRGQYITAGGMRYKIKDLVCQSGKAPVQRLYAMLAVRPNGEKVYLSARPTDMALYEEAKERLAKEDLPLPTLKVRPGHNTDQARGYNYMHWRDFFNARQLLCLGLLLKAILRLRSKAAQEQLLCLFSSTLEFNNLFCSYKGEGTGAVRHMFSNHILKPERTPLENSVWGWETGCSGTFTSLFNSRLLPAKRYLDSPFEIGLNRDLLADAKPTAYKVVASAPIDVAIADTWHEFETLERSVLLLNGDSSCLPIPDDSVDAVLTDPPYFDFVHYSELSDFFFAWLSPALRSRYGWFKGGDSSAPGEVQHKDPRAFARQLGLVFSECYRVLKSEGVLAFSFHHSRADGWAAIYTALIDAGLYVVAAHPVHAEMRSSSPKTAAKSPISLDAILVCKKRPGNSRLSDLDQVLKQTERLVQRLEHGGMALSSGDWFVIAAAQSLIGLGSLTLNFDDALNEFNRLQNHLREIDNFVPGSREQMTKEEGVADAA